MPSESARGAKWHDTLCLTHGEGIMRMLAGKLNGDIHTAHDLTQETLRTAWTRLDSVPEPPGEQLAWLFAVANNHLRNHWRREKKHQHREYDPETMAHLVTSPSADAHLTAPDLELDGKLAALSGIDREILELAFLNNLDSNQIAIALDLKPATARKRLSRARHNLLPILREHYGRDLHADDQASGGGQR